MEDAILANRMLTEKMNNSVRDNVFLNGPFKNQPLWVPYFWNLVKDGCFSSSSDDGWFSIEVVPNDRKLFPLLFDIAKVFIKKDEDGNIKTRVLKKRY
jgi:hypothetical protein